MIRKIKKLVSFLLTILLTFMLISMTPPPTVYAAVDDVFTDTGSGLKFKVLTEDSGSGTGTVLVAQDTYADTAYTIPKTIDHNGTIYTVTAIANFAFSGCTSLAAISIPDGVAEIGVSAFQDCKSLSAINIPDSVTDVWDYAFYGCTGLTSVTFLGITSPKINGHVFTNTSIGEVTVPAGTVADYGSTLSGKLPSGATITAAAATITGVTISPSAVEVVKGGTVTFSAIVSGSGSFSPAVVWSDNSTGSYIGQTDGVLTVGVAESASTLTVTAISLADQNVFGEATVTVKSNGPQEKFSLTVGSTCYFDLSSITVNSTSAALNSSLPDANLKWVPFTYVGTVNAYSLDTSASGVTSASITAAANSGSRSLFVGDYNIYRDISWSILNQSGLIYGRNYTTNGIAYLLRSLSAGSDNSMGSIVPANNEWDQILIKGNLLQNYIDSFSWGQDTYVSSDSRRVIRGCFSAASWLTAPSTYSHNLSSGFLYGYRPALEILNAGSLSSDGLKTVTYEMGDYGILGSGSLTSAAVVYTGELTLPEITSANGFRFTGTPQAGKTLGWNSGSVFYPARTKLSSLPSGTVLTAGYGVSTPNPGSGSNTGNGGGGGGGGGSTPNNTSKAKTFGSTVTATISTTATVDSSGKAAAAVTKDQLNAAVSSAVAEAKKQGGGVTAVVEIKVEAPANSNSIETGIPKEAIGLAANGGTDTLKISTPVASISFDTDALTKIYGEALTDVKITAAKVDSSSLTEDTKQLVGDRPVFNFSVTSGSKTISEFGGNVTVAVPYTPKVGEDTDAIVIYYINAQGKAEIVSNCKYDPATKTVSFTTDHFSQYAVGYNFVSFNDVKDGVWYGNAVEFAAARGIVTGTGNGNYSPDGKLTRAQLLVMLMRAYDIKPDMNLTNNFSDAGNTYYTGYLAAAKRLGITEGSGNNLFAPNSNITRQEMFNLLYNTLKTIGQLPIKAESEGGAMTGYSDADSIASWAKDAAGVLAEAGIIGGNNGKLSPKNTTTRAEMAQVLYNLLSK